MRSFHLDQECWIPVIDLAGAEVELNLVDALQNSEQLREVGGSPVESISLFRMMLAIAHCVEQPTSLDQWIDLWSRRQEFPARMAEYVRSRHGIWNLLDSENPFAQDKSITKTLNPAHLLLYQAARMNNPVLLDHSRGDSASSLELGQIARGILATHSFGGSSGGGYTMGPLCVRTAAIVTGRSLLETILLNLVVLRKNGSFEFSGYASGTQRKTAPSSRQGWLMASSRRILLKPDDQGLVSHAFIGPGDSIPSEEINEGPMVVLRKDAAGKKFVPLRLEAGKGLWRFAHVLLASQSSDAHKPLEVLDQLRRINDRTPFFDSNTLSLRVIGVCGDAQGPSSELWRDESLPFGIDILADEARFTALVQSIEAADKVASTLRKRIYSFAARYLQNGADSKPDKTDIGRLADELAPDLSDYWSRLAGQGERLTVEGIPDDQWSELLSEASRTAYRRAVDRLPADSRRFRAEFARDTATDSGSKR